jgi:hypothetical protein
MPINWLPRSSSASSYELTRIAVDDVSTPPLPLLRNLVELRDLMFGVLRDLPNPG